jgi:hypothetical protein
LFNFGANDVHHFFIIFHFYPLKIFLFLKSDHLLCENLIHQNQNTFNSLDGRDVFEAAIEFFRRPISTVSKHYLPAGFYIESFRRFCKWKTGRTTGERGKLGKVQVESAQHSLARDTTKNSLCFDL